MSKGQVTGISATFSGVAGRPSSLQRTRYGDPMFQIDVTVDDDKRASHALPRIVRVSAWATLATTLARTLREGDRVRVTGRLTIWSWTKGDGTAVHGLNVSALEVIQLDQPDGVTSPPTGCSSSRYKPAVRITRGGQS